MEEIPTILTVVCSADIPALLRAEKISAAEAERTDTNKYILIRTPKVETYWRWEIEEELFAR